MKIDKRFHDKYHAPYGVIHRADMLNVILDACKKSNLIKLATSQKVVAIDDDRPGVTVQTETGETYKGAALIGCDGLWSTVREKIVGDGKPVVSGHIAYRAVLPTAEWPKEYRLPKMIIWCGEKTHLVHYPLRRGELFNLVVVFHSDRYEEGWDTYGDPAELHERFADKCEPVRTLLQKVNAWKMWVLCDRPPIKNWTQGPHHAARRRRASDAAVSRAGRQHGDGGCGLPRQPDRGDAAATTRRRSRNTRSCAICAPRGCSSWRACSARSITPAASIANCATRCCANGARKAASTCRGSTASSRSCRASETCRCRRRRGSTS